MSIITISRGSHHRGKLVAEKLAEKIGYECLGRDVIVRASEAFDIAEGKLVRALHEPPSVLDNFTYAREKYIAYIQYAFLEHIKKDNVVYHGLAGQFFLKDAPNVLKVRILANMEDRIQDEMERENISELEARRTLMKDDEKRRKWSQHLYNIDTHDAGLYDLVVKVDKIGVDDAVDMIASTSELECFESTEQTQAFIDDLYTAATIQATLIDHFPTVTVSCHQGAVRVYCKGSHRTEQANEKKINALLQGVDGIKSVELSMEPAMVVH